MSADRLVIPPCLPGRHKWHFNGVLEVCRRCSCWRKRGDAMIHPPVSSHSQSTHMEKP